jgi:hypothetical protein
VSLGYVTSTFGKIFSFTILFFTLHNRRRMRTYHRTAFAVLDRYAIFYPGNKCDAGVVT